MSNLTSLLTQHFPQLNWQLSYPLAPLSYFKLGGSAEAYLELAELEPLQSLVKFCHQRRIKLTVIGGASNIIVADEGVTGIVLHLLNTDSAQIGSGVSAGAGLKMPLLVSKSIALGFTGLEYFLGVPGTLGGAIYNNAHYLSHLIGNYVTRVQVINRVTGKAQWLTHEECQFEYDHSRFQKSQEIIFRVEFELDRGDKTTSQALIKEATEYRAQTQPLGEASSGCIFQNVPNSPELRKRFPQFSESSHVPGGFLIDQAGMKGEMVGQLEVSHKHAAFMINHGGGTTADLGKLIAKVKSSVKAQFGVELEEEVFYLT